MVAATGVHHPADAMIPGLLTPPYPYSIDFTSQAEFSLALQYFKTVNLGIAAGGMRWPVGNWCNGVSGYGEDHDVCICDMGTAAQLATPYGIAIPSPYTSSTLCLGGITWGSYFVMPWGGMLNVTHEAWIAPTDPDRGDAAAFNPVAWSDYLSMLGTQQRVQAVGAEYSTCS